MYTLSRVLRSHIDQVHFIYYVFFQPLAIIFWQRIKKEKIIDQCTKERTKCLPSEILTNMKSKCSMVIEYTSLSGFRGSKVYKPINVKCTSGCEKNVMKINPIMYFERGR